MNHSQEFEFKKILPISSIEQLVQSHLVAEILMDIREAVHSKNLDEFKHFIPELSSNVDARGVALYTKATELFKFRPLLVYVLSYGMEDLYKYNFVNDPSVTSNGAGDTAHLNSYFGSKFTNLAQIDLLTHTLNVFEEAIRIAEQSGRGSSLSLAILGALFHDFGKSSELRKILMGEGLQKGFKPHAELSAIYIQEILLNKIYNSDIEGLYNPRMIEDLTNVVKNHHPANNKQKEDVDISFVVAADHNARKKEMNFLSLEAKAKK